MEHPCGTSNYTLSYLITRGTHTAANHSQSMSRKHSVPAGQFQVFLFVRGVLPGVHMAIKELFSLAFKQMPKVKSKNTRNHREVQNYVGSEASCPK